MPAVKFFACLDFERKSQFCKRLLFKKGKKGNNDRPSLQGGAIGKAEVIGLPPNNHKKKEYIMASTTDNLKEAFAGESQANQKYRAFAKRAEKDGFVNIAKLFRTTAEAERIHAEGHLKALDMIASTAENLQSAIAGETHEFTEMYPPMVALAEADGHKAKTMFKFAVDAEAVHARIYQQALEAVQKGTDLAESEFYLCTVCGYIELGTPPERCPICGALKKVFTLVGE
jgi:rubrerythrin